jgi:REP element-mobilizing transposase RayT
MRKQRRNSYRLAGHNYADSSHAYFITLQTKIKGVKPGSVILTSAPFTSCPALGQAVNDAVLFRRAEGQLLVFAYVVMPDHVHLLVAPQHGHNLSRVLGHYESYTTRLSWQYGLEGELWQRSFHDHILRRSVDAVRVIEYILNNPLRAGLVDDWCDWPWCGMPDPL